MNKIKILLADDHSIIRDGIKAMLAHVRDFKIVGEAKDGKDVVEKALKLKPDIVIMDISMPGRSGIEATRIINKKNPKIKILVLTQHENDEYIYEILNSGGSGYVLKNTKKVEFVNAIRQVVSGENYFSKNISDLIMKHYLDKTEGNKKHQQVENREILITKREKEIIKLVVKEYSNKEIGRAHV